MEPVVTMASSNATLPGPMAMLLSLVMRRRNWATGFKEIQIGK
jgi:hypothetical protein